MECAWIQVVVDVNDDDDDDDDGDDDQLVLGPFV